MLYANVFIDLNWFLWWSMWPMSLLLVILIIFQRDDNQYTIYQSINKIHLYDTVWLSRHNIFNKSKNVWFVLHLKTYRVSRYHDIAFSDMQHAYDIRPIWDCLFLYICMFKNIFLIIYLNLHLYWIDQILGIFIYIQLHVMRKTF